MKHLKVYSIFESDNKELQDMLSRLKHLQHQASMKIQQDKRRGTIPDSQTAATYQYGKLNDKYEEYFYHLIDGGWEYTKEDSNNDMFYSKIILKKPIRRSEAEQALKEIVEEMNEVSDRFIGDGFKCKFIIDYDGIGQQEINKETYTNDIYQYNGIGDSGRLVGYRSKFPETTYPKSDYFLATIDFIYI